VADARLVRFSGLVLTGGRSTRMGQDKAFLRLPDRAEPLVMTSVRALLDAGATEVVCVGGDEPRLRALGLDVVADDQPGEGPLGGLLTGLRVARRPIVVVLTCDMPSIDAVSLRTIVRVLGAQPDAQAAVPVVDGRQQVISAAYRRAARGVLAPAFAAGERSVRRAIAALTVVDVTEQDGLDPAAFGDVDQPADLDHYAARCHHVDPSTPSGSAAPPVGNLPADESSS
jgi:molybdopterin-guanine dinucleotide biosynthesis protein A